MSKYSKADKRPKREQSKPNHKYIIALFGDNGVPYGQSMFTELTGEFAEDWELANSGGNLVLGCDFDPQAMSDYMTGKNSKPPHKIHTTMKTTSVRRIEDPQVTLLVVNGTIEVELCPKPLDPDVARQVRDAGKSLMERLMGRPEYVPSGTERDKGGQRVH